jgi:hypothetical protein
VQRKRHSVVEEGAEPAHVVGALRAKSVLCVCLSECMEVVGLRRDERIEICHPLCLIGGEVPGMMEGESVIIAGIVGQELLEHVQGRVHSEVAIDVHMDLPAAIPEA